MIAFTPLIGRCGNALFQYAHARALCEQKGWELATPPWIGERIFEIDHGIRTDVADHVLGGYCQNQESLIYSRKWLLDTLRLRPELQARLDSFVPSGEIVAHLRRGDFAGYGYPCISKQSYLQAAEKFGFNPDDIVYVSEEEPLKHPDFTGELAFLPDFYRMMKAKVLFRANSSFSWWASALGEAMTFSPDIRGKPGGVESDCEFHWGNSMQLSELPNMSELNLFREAERYDYQLNSDSVVIDAGGYQGQFAAEINRRYRCPVHIWEPREVLCEYIRRSFSGKMEFTLLNAALGGSRRSETLRVKGDMTGIFADGYSHIETIEVYDVAGIPARFDTPIDLLKLNIEGMEYEVLERILECDIARHFRNIQVQFHTVAPDWLNRYKAIHEGLKRTHRLTFDAPFCWQNWELRA